MKKGADERKEILRGLGEVFRAHGYEGASLALIYRSHRARQGQPL